MPSDGAAAPCPVAWTATGEPSSRAKRTAAATSRALLGRDHDRGAVRDGGVESGCLGRGGGVAAVVHRPGDLSREPLARG